MAYGLRVAPPVNGLEPRFYGDLFGSHTDNQPITELADDHAGVDTPMFEFLHFYNRIWVDPLTLNLGNLISEQIRTISVFNAFFVDHTLDSITSENDSGLTLTQPVSLPFELKPLQELIYTLNASSSGSPDVDASYIFTFDDVTVTVEVIATRVVAWTWEPNWATKPTERLEWLTDVMKSFNGHEQRRALRAGPRQFWEFAFNIYGHDRQRFETILYGWGARPWALPQWMDGADLAADLPAGTVVIPVDTVNRDYHADGIGIFIAGFGETFESFEILSVADDAITLKRAILNDWPAGSRIYPTRTARLQDPRLLARAVRSYLTGTASFRSEEQILGIAAVETQYRGYGVMEFQPNWRDGTTLEFDPLLQELDSQTGVVVWDDESGYPELVDSHAWTALDRATCNQIRQWAYARQGRLTSVWVPSWASDLTLSESLSSTDTQINVLRTGLLQFIDAGAGRRDIRISLVDGSIFYRRVSGFANVDDTSDRMTLSAPLGVDVGPADVDLICWMTLARSDSDSIEIDWNTWSVAETALVLRSVNNDI